MTMYVLVDVLGLIVQGVKIFDDEGMAEAAFKDLTGYDYKEWTKAKQPLHEDYDQCQIFALEDNDINAGQFSYQWVKVREAPHGFKS